MLAVDPVPFRIVLALLAAFGGYLDLSGYRVLARKRAADTAAPVDRAAAAVVAAGLVLGLGELTGDRSAS